VRTGNFFKSSQDIVKSFLSNVVAIDDRLSFGSAADRPDEDQRAEIEDDFDSDADDMGIGVPSMQSATETQTRAELESSAHNLDYQDLSLAFAEYGINCSGFIPDPRRFKSIDDASNKILASTKRADITILDWDMDDKFNEKTGTLALKSIGKLLQHDKTLHGRLRLIVIYTAEPDHKNITEDIKKYLHTIDNDIIGNGDGTHIGFASPDLEFCQICVIAKKATANELREEVINLFTKLTIGLLPNAALSALGELRDKTHHILHSFSRDLDSAYLSHILGLLSSPKVRENADEIAFDYAAELISEEFKSVLQISQPLKFSLEKLRIKEWLHHINNNNDDDYFEMMVGGECGKVGSENIMQLLDATQSDQIIKILQEEIGINKDQDKPLDFFEKNRIQINLKNGPIDSHEKLSIIECKRRDGLSPFHTDYTPNIKLGSIIRSKTGQYYICLQPLCDSVRLSDDAGFIFLSAKMINTPNGKFSHVIQSQNGEKIRLMVRPSSQNIQNFILKRDKQSRTVKAIRNQNGIYVIRHKLPDGKVDELTWVGELKNNVAQAISNNVAASISRVGLDTNEWLRLSAASRDE